MPKKVSTIMAKNPLTPFLYQRKGEEKEEGLRPSPEATPHCKVGINH